MELIISRWPITWSTWLGSRTLRTSNQTSQVRKIVHNFCYTKSNFMRQSAKSFSYFSAQNCVNIFLGFTAVYQIISTNWNVYPIAENFTLFLQLVRVIWETTANRGETLTQSCAEKYEGIFALYCMKFDLVLRKLWMIWLIQEICDPNHADHVIGHLKFCPPPPPPTNSKHTLSCTKCSPFL